MNAYGIPFYIENKEVDDVTIKPYVRFSNQLVEETTNAVADRIMQVFDNLEMVVPDKYRTQLYNDIARIMAANSERIDQVFGIIKGAEDESSKG